MSNYHFFKINDFKGYSIVYVGDKKYEFRIPNENLLFYVVSKILGILLITEKLFPILNKANLKMMDYYVNQTHKLVLLYLDNKISEKTLRNLVKINLDIAISSKSKITAMLVSSVETDFKNLSQKERIKVVSEIIMKMEQSKIVIEQCGIKLSLAENVRLNSLKNYLENEKTKLTLDLMTQKNEIKGFESNLSEKTISEIFNAMTISNPKQIITDLDNFKAIFGIKGYKIQSPVIWNIKRGKEPNKSSLFTFLALVLELEVVPRALLRQANVLFKCGAKDIFADDYSYPSPQEQKSSKLKYFVPIKRIIENSRPA